MSLKNQDSQPKAQLAACMLNLLSVCPRHHPPSHAWMARGGLSIRRETQRVQDTACFCVVLVLTPRTTQKHKQTKMKSIFIWGRAGNIACGIPVA